MTARSRLRAPLRHAVVGLTCAAGLGACTLLTPVDDLSGGPAGPAPNDAATADRSVSPVDAAEPSDGAAGRDDAGDALSDAPGADTGADAARPELHPNGTFETGIVPWVAYHGTVAPDTTARTGAGSLRACAQATVPSDSVFSADDGGAVLGPVVGATYHATAWVRTAPGATAAPSTVSLLFRTIELPPAFAEVETVYSPAMTISTTWTKLELDLPVTKAAQALNVAVTGHYGAGACFLVDDVSVVRTN